MNALFESDVSVKHLVSFASPLAILIDCTPGTVAVVKELRNCVIAIATAWVGLGLFRSFLGYRSEIRRYEELRLEY